MIDKSNLLVKKVHIPHIGLNRLVENRNTVADQVIFNLDFGVAEDFMIRFVDDNLPFFRQRCGVA
jgi:hypothetical protein